MQQGFQDTTLEGRSLVAVAAALLTLPCRPTPAPGGVIRLPRAQFGRIVATRAGPD